jgi:hypothetical protein
MPATLQNIIDRIADEADDFLGEARDRNQARAGVEEAVTAEFSGLSAIERKTVVSAVMSILDREGFFEGHGGDNVWEEEVTGEE